MNHHTILASLLFALHCSAGERKDSLEAALKGADRIQVGVVEMREKPAKPFEFSDASKIAELVSKLDFDEEESGFHCMCLGDTLVTFFKGKEKLAEISHHHGRSLRWNGGKWKDDSLFTADAAKAWRLWFDAQGEPRFEAMYQKAVAEAKQEQEVHDRFMQAFNPAAREVFESSTEDDWNTFAPEENSLEDKKELSPLAKKFVGTYANKTDLGKALAASLGSLTLTGAQEGSWSVSSGREQLVIECAKTLGAENFRAVLDSKVEEVLAGAARLFFFEKFATLVPADLRGAYAAKLCRVVIQKDKCGNADRAVRALGDFPCPETITLLEQLAAGSIAIQVQDGDHKDEPSPRSAACLILGKLGSDRVAELAKAVEQSGKIDKIDQAALIIARSFAGERGLIGKTVFEIDSYTIGFGALAALEKEGGKTALDAVIMGGTKHGWAAIREEAVLSAERMIGRKWYKNQENERAEWHGKDIREWWQKNRESHILPAPKAD